VLDMWDWQPPMLFDSLVYVPRPGGDWCNACRKKRCGSCIGGFPQRKL